MAKVSERMDKLRAMLQKQPDDPFLNYALALEHKKHGEQAEALQLLHRVLELDEGYCYAYHQRGLIYESIGQEEQAKQAYREGIAAAEKMGDAHAREEIAAALSMIE